MGLLSLVAEAGLGSAVVQAPKLDEQTLRRIFGVVILVNGVLFALQVAIAPLVARFFEEERLVAILRVLAVQFLLMTFAVIPGALLNRRLDFKSQSMIGLAASGARQRHVVGARAGRLRSLGAGDQQPGVADIRDGGAQRHRAVCALASVLAAGNASHHHDWRPGHGGACVVFRLSQADVFIGGRIFGKDLLGFYSISLHLASLPVQKISSIVNHDRLPAFAEAQHDCGKPPAGTCSRNPDAEFSLLPGAVGHFERRERNRRSAARPQVGGRGRSAPTVAPGDAGHHIEPFPEYPFQGSARLTSCSRMQ